MKSNFWLSFLLTLATLVLAACAGRESKTAAPRSGGPYTPLSEAEAKIYTTPTIYYIPQFDLSAQSCEASDKKVLKDKKDNVLFDVCSSVYDSCLLQGTCELRSEQGRFLLNVAGKVDSEYRFMKVQNKTCSYGFGAGRAICLDPFHSVAADLSIYKLGQVIYIPSVVGLGLPDGSRHDGYFVVRDSGGSIKGYGRFDFFTGFLSNNRAKNPLAEIGFAGKETHTQYYVLDGNEAESILKKRNYPFIPVSN